MKYIDFGNKIIFVFDLSYENELIGNKEYNWLYLVEDFS